MTKKIWGGLIAAILFASIAVGGCLQDGGTLLQSLDCTGLPTIDKYYQPKTFEWKGVEVLVVNRGNEFSMWDITNPNLPVLAARSRFLVKNQGDSDHDLTGYSVCDDCRFGIAVFKLGVVVFDMGTGPKPTFPLRDAKTFYPGMNPRASFTYKNGSDQYIISKDLPGGGLFNRGTIYKVTAHNGLTKTETFQQPPGAFQSPVTGGFDFGDLMWISINGNFYLYRKDGGRLIFERNLEVKAPLEFLTSAARVGDRVVTATDWTADNGLKLWDVSDPASPALLDNVTGKHKMVGFSGQHVVTSTHSGSEITTYAVEADRLTLMDQEFWDPAQPWNQWPPRCSAFMGAVFSDNGNWAFLARSSVFQKINFTNCGWTQPTPTPTPLPWPTPRPTCVPGCVSSE